MMTRNTAEAMPRPFHSIVTLIFILSAPGVPNTVTATPSSGERIGLAWQRMACLRRRCWRRRMPPMDSISRPDSRAGPVARRQSGSRQAGGTSVL